MKRAVILLLVLVSMIMLPVSAYVANPIDPAHPSGLTLEYRSSGVPCVGLTVQTYRIAEIFEDGTFSLVGAFAGYPVNIHGITSQAQWQEVTTTLASYAQADGLIPDLTGVTDASGMVSYADILPGIYMTLSVREVALDRISVFENFLTVIPGTNEAGEHEYHVTAKPKYQSFVPTPETVEYQVIKQWADSGYTKDRPQAVRVEILKDGVLQQEQTLSPENDWTYRWTAPNDGSQWQVVERDVLTNYTVSITKRSTTFFITNLHKDPYEPPPKTGDTTVLWPYMLAMCGSGIVLVLLGLLLWRKKK